MKRGGCVVWGLGIVALLWGIGWVMYRPYRPSTYRYKVTVEVITPSGPRRGAAVREIEYARAIPVMTQNEFRTRARGEAVAVDLPGGQTLFVLMDIDAHETIRAAVAQGRGAPPLKELLDRAESSRQIYVYPSRERLRAHNGDFPWFVRFRNIADPLSAEILAPDKLDAAFGPGVALGRMTVQMVDEPVTNDIPRRLPWRSRFPNGMLNGDRAEFFAKKEAAAHLSAFAFSTEPVK